jgi:hypothetical protein
MAKENNLLQAANAEKKKRASTNIFVDLEVEIEEKKILSKILKLEETHA